MLNTSPISKVKVPGKTSGRYLLLALDPKDCQVDPQECLLCHSLPLSPHVCKESNIDQVSKVPPEVKL